MENTPTTKFQLTKLAKLCGDTKDWEDTRKARSYMSEYFYWTNCGLFFYDVGKQGFKQLFDNELKAYIPNGVVARFQMKDMDGKMRTCTWKARKWLEDDVFERYEIVSKLGEPLVNNEKMTINMMPAPMHQDPDGHPEPAYEEYASLSFGGKPVKPRVQLMLDHIRNVWCSGNEKQHEYVMDWLSCTGRRKLKSALYLQSLEQTGKTLVIEFLEHYVFGKQLVYMTSSMEVIHQYTAPLEGKILVNINEMPCATTGEWRKLMNKLKSLITDSTFDCRQMYSNPRIASNTFNMIMTSNNDAISMDSTNNKRYKCLDVSNDMIGNAAYFNKLVDSCFNDRIGQAFYLLLSERFTSRGHKMNADSFPVTVAFTDKMCHRLELVYEFLKEKHIKRGFKIEHPLRSLYAKYVEFCKKLDSKDGRKVLTDKQFSKKMKELQCVTHKRAHVGKSRLMVFHASVKDLHAEFLSKGFIHELDDVPEVPEATNDAEPPVEHYDLLMGAGDVDVETSDEGAEGPTDCDTEED